MGAQEIKLGVSGVELMLRDIQATLEDINEEQVFHTTALSRIADALELANKHSANANVIAWNDLWGEPEYWRIPHRGLLTNPEGDA